MDSPCVKVCVIEPDTGFCQGCRRTLAEIAAWSTMTSTQRLGIMDLLGARNGASNKADHGSEPARGALRR